MKDKFIPKAGSSETIRVACLHDKTLTLKADPKIKRKNIWVTTHSEDVTAGLLDGKGGFCVSKNGTVTVELTLSETKAPLLKVVQKRFGGLIKPR